MKNSSILVFEIAIITILVFIGLSGKRILFIQGARSATIVLGIIGMLLCTLSVGKFIASAPAHPLSILGYIFGIIAILAFMVQLFKWNVPKLDNPQTALITLAIAMLVKSVIARFGHLIIR